MNHGTATVKKEILINDKVIHEIGKVGIITCFLPSWNKYAVMFEGWGPENPEAFFSFDEESFEKHFDYILHDEATRSN
jgi:hypothetical protein